MSATGGHKTWGIIILAILLISVFSTQPALALVLGCSVNSTYSSGAQFLADDFNLTNVSVDENGYLSLNTGDQAITPNRIIIPFDQEVWVSFFYENAGYQSTLGWMYKSDAIGSDEKFLGWENIDSSKRHPIFRNIIDGSDGGDGILDQVSGLTEEKLAVYDDGTLQEDNKTLNNFIVDGDKKVTQNDMKKSLGDFEANTELVFFFGANQDYTSMDSSSFFFTKPQWNKDRYTECVPPAGDIVYWTNEAEGIFKRKYRLGREADSSDACTMTKGLLDKKAIDRLQTVFKLTLAGLSELTIENGKKFPHVIAAAPKEDKNQWILSWEDKPGGGDMDYNDTTFRIELKTGGSATAKSVATLAESSYYTAVTFEVYDYIPGGACAGQTTIDYQLSIDGGGDGDWVNVDNWDTVKSFTLDGDNKIIGTDVPGWTPGSPEYTYRSARIDFAGRGMSGRKLVWRVDMKSDDNTCVPKVVSTAYEGSVATHGFYSRSSPVMAGNVLYAGSYESPESGWTEIRPRGHVWATRLYAPEDTSETDTLALWDAGAALQKHAPDDRIIYFPKVTDTQVTNEVLTLTRLDGSEVTAGDGVTTTFTGTLKHAPILAGTLTLNFAGKNFEDRHTDELFSDWGRDSTINRFTGEFKITFNTPLAEGVPVVANYTYYTTDSTPLTFTTNNITNSLLGLNDNYVNPGGYIYDLNGDNSYDEKDGEWLVEWVRGYANGTSEKTPKQWKLGSVDHSTPALLTPPGTPTWYYGSDTTDKERDSYKLFKTAHARRKSVLFVGAFDGMVHAFDAGEFRWGDNPETLSITEQRGYFEWQDLDGNSDTPKTPNYGDGKELWAFIPANLLSKLKNNLLSGEDRAHVDASPSLADVYINDEWRSVLLSAEGNGGDTIFCLDVTDPLNPTFLWEFADPDLFRSRSSPAVGKVGRIMDKGKVRWAAFFVSGKTYDADEYPSIYVIDIADGSVIKRIFLDSDTDGSGGVPSGQPAIIDSDGNGYIDRLYVGTDKGRMYKVNLADDPDTNLHDIENCVINTDFDTDDGSTIDEDQRWHPIYASPTVLVDNGTTPNGKIDYNIRVFFGTGDSPYYDEDINTATRYHFFAYNDQNGKSECKSESGGVSDTDAVKLDWFFQLEAGERVFASAFAAAGQIYFGTSTSETEDPCESPEDTRDQGKMYVFSTTYSTNPATSITQIDTGDIISTPLVQDGHLIFKTTSGTQIIGDGYNTMSWARGMGDVQTTSWREISN